MIPSRELDRLVAEKVMGWVDLRVAEQDGGRGLTVYGRFNDKFGRKVEASVPAYSSDISAAWEVLEKVGRTWRGFEFMVFWQPDPGGWRVGWFEYGHEIEGRATGYSVSVAHAICLAALTAVGVEVRE